MQPSDNFLSAGLPTSADLDGDYPRVGAVVDSDDILNLIRGFATLPNQRATNSEVRGVDVEY